MERVLNGYRPEAVFDYFEQLCAIPHGSYHEAAAADFLCAFAEERGLVYRRDEMHNVLIRKPASAGYENEPVVMLQGHTDMVCVKRADKEHDFLHDPLTLIVEDGWIRADGTTLGGDDGIAVAMMMAILSDDSLPHPELECLFTVQEEVGLRGAKTAALRRVGAVLRPGRGGGLRGRRGGEGDQNICSVRIGFSLDISPCLWYTIP